MPLLIIKGVLKGCVLIHSKLMYKWDYETEIGEESRGLGAQINMLEIYILAYF
jgi:hypothetical protein